MWGGCPGPARAFAPSFRPDADGRRHPACQASWPASALSSRPWWSTWCLPPWLCSCAPTWRRGSASGAAACLMVPLPMPAVASWRRSWLSLCLVWPCWLVLASWPLPRASGRGGGLWPWFCRCFAPACWRLWCARVRLGEASGANSAWALSSTWRSWPSRFMPSIAQTFSRGIGSRSGLWLSMCCSLPPT